MRAMLVEAHQKSSEAYDKALMTLAGGALAVSITFIHDVAPQPKHKGWIATSWGLFSASLLAVVLSFIASQHSILRQIYQLDKRDVFRWNLAGKSTSLLNYIAGGTFIAGVACLVRFADR